MTIEVEVSTSGLDFESIADSLDNEAKQRLVERLAEVAYHEAFYGAPWKTGKLARSIVMEVNEQGEAKIRALAPYAKFVVEGTRPHKIYPVRAGVLAFKTAAGDIVFTRVVRHPGTKPNPFLTRALDKAREKVDEVWADLFLELVEEATS